MIQRTGPWQANRRLVSPASPSSATSATTAFLARAGFVHRQRASLMLLTIQRFDRCLDVAVPVHFHEAETFAATALAIRNHLRTLHRAVGGKQLLQVRAGHTITQISDVQPLTQRSISLTATGTRKPAAEQERPRIALRDRLTPTLTPGPGLSQYKLTPARRTDQSRNHFFELLRRS